MCVCSILHNSSYELLLLHRYDPTKSLLFLLTTNYNFSILSYIIFLFFFVAGSIEIFNIREVQLIKSIQVCSCAITELCVVAEQYLIVLDELNDVYTFSIDAMLEGDEESDETAVNSLGESSKGMLHNLFRAHKHWSLNLLS